MESNTSSPTQAEASSRAAAEPPRYQLIEPAYINDVHYDQAQIDKGTAIIVFEGVPGYHMRPLNAAAKAMVAKHKPKFVDPLNAMTSMAPPKE